MGAFAGLGDAGTKPGVGTQLVNGVKAGDPQLCCRPG
jgi:hypothetical protein